MQATEQEQVLIRGKCFLYKQKAPFVPSGMSVLGALEYRERDDMVRCHECGGWFRHVGSHLWPAHKMTARQYKQRHGLRLGSALCSLGVSKSESLHYKHTLSSRFHIGRKDPEVIKRTAAAAAAANREAKERRLENGIGTKFFWGEQHNLRGTCQAQILNSLKSLQEKYNRTPTITEMEANGISPKSVLAAFNLSKIRDVMGLIGFLPTKVGRQEPKYSKELLAECLRDFYVKQKRLPGCRDYGRTVPYLARFTEQFGSMVKAYEFAGLLKAMNNAQRGHSPGVYSKESVIAGMQRFYTEHGRLPTKSDRDGLPSPPTFVKLFGSMRAAWEAAGLTDAHVADRIKNLRGKDQLSPTSGASV